MVMTADEIAVVRKSYAYTQLRRRVIAEEIICWLCRRPVDKTLPGNHPDGPTLDHVIELDAGGSPLDRANARLAHHRCNSARGARYRHMKERAARRNTTPRTPKTTRRW